MGQAIVIGAGPSGLASACYLAAEGHQVQVLERHAQVGGRARQFQAEGFTFDMGPSWYWMPDAFETFFGFFGKKPSDYYELIRLDPSYRVFFPGEQMDLPADMAGLEALFERIEPGAGLKLRSFLADAGLKYSIAMDGLVQKPSHSIFEFAEWRVMKGALRLNLFTSFSKFIRRSFRDPRLLQLLEFPILFLGAKPQDTPALYSMMNHADMGLGTWYPMGGMHEIFKGMASLATELGVEFQFNAPVSSLELSGKKIVRAHTPKGDFEAEAYISSADYHHTEQQLLPPEGRRYSEAYWDKRMMAPSCLLYYIGVNKEIPGLLHHNLFFDEDFGRHAQEIYDNPQWPSAPLFYACAPSKTDPSVAPKGSENLFLLIPVAPGLTEQEGVREKYLDLILDRLEARTGTKIREHIVYQRSFAHREFLSEYSSFKGNAYGLANTLRQTAILKPKMKNGKVKNLRFAGQLTVPGPGLPPALISGQMAANDLMPLLSEPTDHRKPTDHEQQQGTVRQRVPAV